MSAKPKLHTITSGYFPNTMRAIAEHAQYGNDKHNPGEPLHWAFNKSTEHAESAARHLQEADQIDPETGRLHAIGLAMRAMMLAETLLIKGGAVPGWAVFFDDAEAELFDGEGVCSSEELYGPKLVDVPDCVINPGLPTEVKWPVVDPDGFEITPTRFAVYFKGPKGAVRSSDVPGTFTTLADATSAAFEQCKLAGPGWFAKALP